MESTNTPGVHVLGDAIFPAPTMPKSGHMANQHGKLAAAAILNLLSGQEPNPTPVVMNTCYSFVDAKNVIHVASVHQYDEVNQDRSAGQGRWRRVDGTQRNRRQGSHRLGEEHLGRHADLSLPVLPKTVLAALAGVELIDHIERQPASTGTTHQLRNSIERIEREALVATIPHRHHQLALIIRIDQADQIAQHDAVLVTKPERGRIIAARPGSAR
jgi:hypothetical protein